VPAPVIVGDGADSHVRAVTAALCRDHRLDPIVLDAASLARSRYRWRDEGLSIQVNGDWVRLAGGRGWLRRFAPDDWSVGVALGSRPAAERAAWLNLLTALAEDGRTRWLSPLDAIRRAENKLVAAIAATALGIPTPRTEVVGDVADASGQGDVIVKPLGPGDFRGEGGEPLVVYTARRRRDDPDLAYLGGAPFVLQELLVANEHLRVVTVTQEGWACRLAADGLPVDWRKSADAHHAWEVTPRSEVVGDAIRLAHHLGLGYSSQDWIVTDDGTYVVDVNPAGQWLFLPDDVAQSVTRAIAGWLAGARE